MVLPRSCDNITHLHLSIFFVKYLNSVIASSSSEKSLVQFNTFIVGGLGVSRKTKNGSSKRLPCVSSAPHLNNNVHSTKEEIAFLNGKSLPPTEEKKEKKEKTIEEIPAPKKKTKMAQAGHLLKMTILVACWMFFTVVFLMYNEKEQLSRHSSVAPGEVKSYTLQTDKDQLSVLLKLTGPFVSEQNEKKLNSSDKLNMPRMDVWLEGDGYEAFKEDTNQSSHWLLYLDPHDQIDFTLGETRSQVLKLDPTTTRRSPSANRTVYAVKISTTANTTTPFALSYSLDPIELSTGVIYACMLLCALYILIIFEVSVIWKLLK
ncbi:hypothetical protein B5X24_HaOG210884 [Helicoverpa armigera]|uniref:Uncharacterized protein n=1 Tax=Helicoverpa armigera TaxID=29058 RepID=A0A2W1BFW4_HELAM|nr:hypothetical protein B5X24_HaOG210884 [Helicoverpa armigera]